MRSGKKGRKTRYRLRLHEAAAAAWLSPAALVVVMHYLTR